MSAIKTQDLLHELNLEYTATRRCLERIPASLFGYRPHPKSMTLGYLAELVAMMPLWVKFMLVEGEIDLATFPKKEIRDTEALLTCFEENMEAARAALSAANDEALESDFSLKANGQLLYSSKKRTDLGVTLNHWVHHRGQLTVYMRLNDIEVPSIYGPSADDKSFTVPK